MRGASAIFDFPEEEESDVDDDDDEAGSSLYPMSVSRSGGGVLVSEQRCLISLRVRPFPPSDR